jgi:hypothetical protein
LDQLLRSLLSALDEREARAAYASLDLFWARLAMHIRAENLHLFPAIFSALDDDGRKRPNHAHSPEQVREAIGQLRRDHDFFMHELASAVKIMRELLTTPGSENAIERLEKVRRIIKTLSDRLEAHNRLEEEQVYRLPAKLLEAAEQSVLAARMLREIENLPPRFQ